MWIAYVDTTGSGVLSRPIGLLFTPQKTAFETTLQLISNALLEPQTVGFLTKNQR
jgi:hypothetical protein